MPPNIPCCTIVINGVDDSKDYLNSDVVSNRNSSRPYNILQHADITHRPCVKKVAKAVTTYRDHYCGIKCLPEPPKKILPYPALYLSNEKSSTITTYTDHFRPFSYKKQQDSRGKIIPQKPHIVYENKPFGGKSETKSAYRYLDVSNRPLKSGGMVSSIKQIDRFKENQPFTATTTYSSAFGVPKRHERATGCAPKLNISVPKEPFKHVSQYKSEFKCPRMKKNPSECRSRRMTSYKPPTEPMDKKTTYNLSYTFKTPSLKPSTHRPPDLRCEACRMHSEKQKRKGQHPRKAYEVPQSIRKEGYNEGMQNRGDGDMSVLRIKNNVPNTVAYHCQDICDGCRNSSDKMHNDKARIG